MSPRCPGQRSIPITAWSRSVRSYVPSPPKGHHSNQRARKSTEEAKQANNTAVAEAMAGGTHKQTQHPHEVTGEQPTTHTEDPFTSPHAETQQQEQLDKQWQTLQRAVQDAVEAHIPKEPHPPKQPWITHNTWELIQQRSQAREDSNAEEAQQGGPQTSAQRQNPVAQRPARGTRTDDGRRDEMKVDQAYPLGLQTTASIHPQRQGQASQPVQTSRDLRGTPGQLTVGPAIPPGNRDPIAPQAAVQQGPVHDGGAQRGVAEGSQAVTCWTTAGAILQDWQKALVVEIYKGGGPDRPKQLSSNQPVEHRVRTHGANHAATAGESHR